MSNRTTDVFLDLLVLSGSFLAKTEAEKELVVWLSEHDQNFVGDGTVSFDIIDMPWRTTEFESQKEFLISALEAAVNGFSTDKLTYRPDMKYMKPFFKKFSDIITQLSVDMVNEDSRREWIKDADHEDPIINGFPCCNLHGVLLSTFGCRFCGRKKK